MHSWSSLGLFYRIFTLLEEECHDGSSTKFTYVTRGCVGVCAHDCGQINQLRIKTQDNLCINNNDDTTVNNYQGNAQV